MAQTRREIEIALKARADYQSVLRKATRDFEGFAAAQAKTAARRNHLKEQKAQLEALGKAAKEASRDAQMLYKELNNPAARANLSPEGMADYEKVMVSAREKAAALKRELNEQRVAFNAVKNSKDRSYKAFIQRIEAEQRLKAATQQTTTSINQQRTAADRSATSLKRKQTSTDQAAQAQRRLKTATAETTAEMEKQKRQGDYADQMAGRMATRQQKAFLGLRPYEMVNLGYQVNDVISGLAMGQSPMMIFAQQAGQIIQLFPKLGAAIIRFSPVIGLLAPFGIALAEINREATRLAEVEQALTLMGNSAQYNADKLASLIATAQRSGNSLDEARKAIMGMAEARLPQTMLTDLAEISIELSKLSGDALPDVAKKMTDAFSEGVDGVRKLDQEMNFLTASQYEMMRQMAANGDEAGALEIAIQALNDRLEETSDKAKPSGPWSRAITNLGQAWRGFIDYLKETVVVEAMIAALDQLGQAAEWVTAQLAGLFEEAVIPDNLTDSNIQGALFGLLSERSALEVTVEFKHAGYEDAAARIAEIDAQAQNLRSLLDMDAEDRAAADALVDATADILDNSLATSQAVEDALVARENEKLEAARAADELERQKKLEIDIGGIIDTQVDAMAEELALAEMSNKERFIEQKLLDARNEALARANELGLEFLGLTEAQTAAIRQQAEALFQTQENARNAGRSPDSSLFAQMYANQRAEGRGNRNQQLVEAASIVGAEFGLSPRDLLTIFSYETGGTLDPWQRGPTTQWGQHRGLIQWGEPQAEQYGVDQNTSILDQVRAAAQYMMDRGVRSGDGLLPMYASVNAGHADRIHASDENNGGAPGTVLDKVQDQMDGHAARADGLLEAYAGVARAAEETYAAEQQRLESAEQFHDRQAEQIETERLRQSFGDDEILQRELALALREAELAAQQAGTQLTDQERADIEEITRNRVESELVEQRRNEALREGRRLEGEVDRLLERRAYLQERGAYAMSIGDRELATETALEMNALSEELDSAIEKAIAFWQAMGGEGAAATIQKLQQTREELGRIEQKTLTTGKAMNTMLADKASAAFNRFAQDIANGENVLQSFGRQFQQMAAEILIELGQMIMKQILFNAISGMFGGGMGGGGGLGGLLAGGVNALVAHTGAVAGKSGGSRRMVPAAMFANAPRYHTGGIAGLAPNEMTAIVERGEEILTEDNPRHINNAGGQGDTEVRNFFDPVEFFEAGARTEAGRRIIYNIVKTLPAS